MDQEKIGKFIAANRKRANMTQSQLANRLQVTDRAVSNWEVGKNMPDLSLFKPLCEILDITINELLSGEKIANNYQEKFEENIINTISYSKQKIDQKNKMIGLVLLLFGFSFSTFGLMAFNTDTHACLFSVVLGLISSTLGFFILIKTKSHLKNFLMLTLFLILNVSLALYFDYLGVSLNNRPPIFAKTITSINETIYYDTFFYDVVRCNKNKENETYEVIPNQKFDDDLILNICEK